MLPAGDATGLGSGDGREVAWRDRSRIRLVSVSIPIDSAPVGKGGNE